MARRAWVVQGRIFDEARVRAEVWGGNVAAEGSVGATRHRLSGVSGVRMDIVHHSSGLLKSVPINQQR